MRHMPPITRLCVAALLLATAGCASRPGQGPGLQVADAQRFAQLLNGPQLPDAARLQQAYLNPGSEGVHLFTPGRIETADKLATQLQQNPAAYRKAVALCLPAAQAVAAESAQVMAAVAQLLGETEPAPAFALFGAMNSGGTAKAQGLALGLEVLCQGVDTPAEARAFIQDFVAHEITHVYQHRRLAPGVQFNLLYASLMEGFADHVMVLARGAPSAPSADRTRYGLANEAALWRAFKADVDRNAGFGPWLYGPVPGNTGQPRDMGYWLGQRICEAYLARAPDRQQALRTLLELRDPLRVLAESGYGQQWAAHTP